eukprot:TRINITY_DN24895_c0_g1_i1.p1 TRINITY_DN24895_c0_g1~~TRINITY_DN24895_c0_g1_i1.p1  ORF type:complete len:135 (+),score=44.68 TRINITY_DN24895_c0_g1_i1:320-724(+)
MSSSPLVGKKRVRLEFYIAPGVSVTHPKGSYELDSDTSLELMGNKFLKDVKDPGTHRSAVDTLTAEWAVLRAEGETKTFGFPSLPIGDTGLFAAIEGPGDQITLVPAGHPSVTLGHEEVPAPTDDYASGCCVMQ